MNDVINNLNKSFPSNLKAINFIDSGGQGCVFGGEYNNQKVAIKVFDSFENQRIEREIRLLQDVNCKNIVKILDFFTIKINKIDKPVIIYEYLDGGDLRKYLEPQAKPLSLETLISIGLQMSIAIEYLWNMPLKIVHRDIKPGNIVESNTNEFVLVDLGLARHLGRSDLTAQGYSPGTRGYKSPEQQLGRRNLTLTSDIFSLGVTLYELTSKIHPFHRDQTIIPTHQPEDLISRRQDVTVEYTNLIHSMMNKTTWKRPNNITEQFEKIRLGLS